MTATALKPCQFQQIISQRGSIQHLNTWRGGCNRAFGPSVQYSSDITETKRARLSPFSMRSTCTQILTTICVMYVKANLWEIILAPYRKFRFTT